MKKKEHSGRNRREHYRVEYPISSRPKLIIEGIQYEVMDVSEKGIRFLSESSNEFQVESEVKGKIVFHDNEVQEVEGTILRVAEKQTIIYLSVNISFFIIVQEQRYIRDNFVDWFKE